MTISLKLLPGTANNFFSFNSTPWTQDNVVTVGGFQYACWYNQFGEPIVAQRTYPDGEWSIFNLSTVTGNPLVSPVEEDGHNSLQMGVSSDGLIHVAGNMHNDAMRYVRSTVSHDITAWTDTPKPASAFLVDISYPQFVRTDNGNFYVFYREGLSGNGDVRYSRWNPGTSTWISDTKLLDGRVSNVSPYLHRIGINGDEIHLGIIWRDTSLADSNEDVSHMVSRDAGVTWESQQGVGLAVPITHATVPMVFPTTPTGSGLVNQGGLDVDLSGNPHIITLVAADAPETGTRFLYSRWTGSAWVNVKVFDDWTIGTTNPRPGIIATNAGRILVIYRNENDAPPHTLRVREVTAGRSQTDASILNIDLGDLEIAWDTRAVHDEDKLIMLVTPAGVGENNVPLGILTVDLANIDQVLGHILTIPSEWVNFTSTIVATPALVPDISRVLGGSHNVVFEARVLETFQTGVEPVGTILEKISGEIEFDGTRDAWADGTLRVPGTFGQDGSNAFPRGRNRLLAPWGNEIFIRYGIDLGGDEPQWFPLGYFRISDTDQDDAPYNPIELSLDDRMSTIIESELISPRSYDPPATVGDVFVDLVGEIYPNAVIEFDDSIGIFPLGRQVIAEKSRYNPLQELAASFGKVMFWNAEGILRIESPPDTTQVSWRIASGRNGVLVNARRKLSRKGIYNAVVVEGEGADPDFPIRAVAYDGDPTSPTRFGGPLGRVPKFLTTPLVTTSAQASNAALVLLRRAIGAPYNVEMDAITNPSLRPLQVIDILYSNNERDVHVIDSVSIPLDEDASMSCSTRENALMIVGNL